MDELQARLQSFVHVHMQVLSAFSSPLLMCAFSFFATSFHTDKLNSSHIFCRSEVLSSLFFINFMQFSAFEILNSFFTPQSKCRFITVIHSLPAEVILKAAPTQFESLTICKSTIAGTHLNIQCDTKKHQPTYLPLVV